MILLLVGISPASQDLSDSPDPKKVKAVLPELKAPKAGSLSLVIVLPEAFCAVKEYPSGAVNLT